MTRLIDEEEAFNVLSAYYKHRYYEQDEALLDALSRVPTVDAVPTEFVMENCNLDFICDELTDDGEWCSEHCQYSEPQPECIHRYIDRIWRKEHDQDD